MRGCRPCSAYHLCFHNIISMEPMHSVVLSGSDARVSESKSGLRLALCILLGIW